MSGRTIGEVSIQPPLENTIVLAPQMPMTPAAKKIFTDDTLGNACTNRTPHQVSRKGVRGTTPGKIVHACEISKTSSQTLIGIIGTTAPPCGLNVSPDIGNKRQPAIPDFINSNELDTSIDLQFTNHLFAPLIFTEVLGENFYDSSRWDIYTRCRMNLVSDHVNIPAPKFVDLELSNINALDKCAIIYTPATIFGRPTDVSHGRAMDYIFEKLQWLETL